ncbi:Crp/Fnr family transcriptional regulator [Prosthecomicrobium sp. N25]|uniref:Crp/Fnr family transcriptional regulator n=1 Tax=Prosthecomicrobium sp. N25 TaxID=3129254 RepID=UPI003076AB88
MQLLTPFELSLREPIEDSGVPFPFVVFPESGLISVVAVNSAGEVIEAGLVGAEGMTGVSLLHGVNSSPNRTYVQIAGHGYRIRADVLSRMLQERPAMRAHFLRYAQAFMIQVAHTALANGRHTLDERLARWLLMCHDRMVDDDIPLTHEFLSVMLGVRRPGVTTALHLLEGSKIVRARRSHIIVLDRTKLEDSAGHSYGVPEMEYQRLMGTPPQLRAVLETGRVAIV